AVDKCLADPRDVVEHLLVGVVEHLVRVLGGVKRLVGLGCDDVVGSLEETHEGLLLADCGRSPRDGSGRAGRHDAHLGQPVLRAVKLPHALFQSLTVWAGLGPLPGPSRWSAGADDYAG